MKIAIVVERFPPDIGGSGVRFFEIAQRLKNNHEVDILTLGRTRPQGSLPGFNVHRFYAGESSAQHFYGLNRVIGLSCLAFLRLLIRSYDIIDVDFWPIFPFFVAKIAAPRTPIVVSWNVAWPFSFRRSLGRMSRALAQQVFKLSTRNVTVSNFAKKNLIENLGTSPKEVEIIPNGVDKAFFNARPKPQWGRMVFVGRLESQKRFDLLLAAFQIVRKTFEDAEFHIVGSGPLREMLLAETKRVEGLYLHDPIPRDDVEELISELSRSWIFVSASEFETYGMSIAEALCVGLPVVSTRAPQNAAIDEIVVHGRNGLTVEHGNPKAIAEAIEKLYTNAGLWKQLSYNAKHLTSISSWDEVAAKTEAMYRSILGNIQDR